MIETFLGGRVIVKVGDITAERVDAIVNAANSSLMGGGGVDGAIHSAGGPTILNACREIRRNQFPEGLPTGGAVITTGGSLPAKYVIHTVGPIYGRHGGDEDGLLEASYRNSLALALENAVSTISFPAISTGVYGFPKNEAARVASSTVAEFLGISRDISEVRFVFFSRTDADIFLSSHVF